MEVRWRGDLCFELEESTGTTVLLEPQAADCTFKNIDADIVAVGEIKYVADVKKILSDKSVLIERPDIIEHKGVTVSGTNPVSEEQPIIFKVRMDGIDICYLGRTSAECDIEIVSDLLPVDVLIVPVGGEDTLDADEAMTYVDALMPDVVVPMHYKTKGHGDLDKLSAFLKNFEDHQILPCEEDFYEISRDDITHESTTVLVPDKHLV